MDCTKCDKQSSTKNDWENCNSCMCKTHSESTLDETRWRNLWKCQVPARHVLYLLTLSGFTVNNMLRSDMNIAIVAMVKEPTRKYINSSTESCFAVNETSNNVTSPVDYGGTLEWSSNVQGYVLAAFYWAYIFSQVFGGVAAQKLSTKMVFGFGQLGTALCSLNIPWASETHVGIVIALRFIQGLASGVTFPAIYALIAHWIPTPERGRFMSSFIGFPIGLALTYPMCGFLIAQFGWHSVFYTTGCIGIVWCIIWYLLAFDNPSVHPRISLKEQQYIRANTDVMDKKQAIPWKAIVTSMPVWSIAITTFGRIWILNIFMMVGPTYMKRILGFSVEKSGLLSGLPFVYNYAVSVVCGYAADKLVLKNYMTLTNVRKLMSFLSQVLPGILVVVITYLGCNINLIIVVWCVAAPMTSAGFSGAMANVVDIAPNFASTVMGFAQTIHMTASFLCPLAVFHIINEKEHLLSSWRMVFYVSCFVACSTYMVFQIWGTGDIQPWNNSDDSIRPCEQEELMSDPPENVVLKEDTARGSIQK